MQKNIMFLLFFFMFSCETKLQKPLSDKVENVEIKDISQAITKNYVMGKFLPEEDKRFILIPKKYADRTGLFLRSEAFQAFEKMYKKALSDGITLTIRSATRNFNYQKGIWERKWTGKTKIEYGINAQKKYPDYKTRALNILKFSSMPGTSRHHWGTDIDLNSFENEYFEKGDGLKTYNWLKKHAKDYGFCQVYTKKDKTRPEGYEMEKWHWSYIPLASRFTTFAENNISYNDITGFEGFETAKDLDVVKKYILGINPECR